MSDRIGFMQGRFSDLVDGQIQAFPWSSWREEFSIAQQNGFHLMEWTLDQKRLYENPLLTPAGQSEIMALSDRNGVHVASLTGDCFMQEPFWKAVGEKQKMLQKDFQAIVRACGALGIAIIVMPLVDRGSLENSEQEEILVGFLKGQTDLLSAWNVRIVFESDFPPSDLARLMNRFDPKHFGVNYDIGNSAALGFDVAEEFSFYGDRIYNVHVKDRLRNGGTVPLKSGAADFETVFASLKKIHYSGNLILQTARAQDGDHVGALCHYRDQVVNWTKQYAA